MINDWDRVLVVGVDFGTLSSRAPVVRVEDGRAWLRCLAAFGGPGLMIILCALARQALRPRPPGQSRK